MALIPQEEINEIRAKADIVDVISSYIPLNQKGKNYLGVCPFHTDHSPSMSVSKEKQIYKCFSCGAAGNVFTFVQNYENVSFLEAVKIVAARYGLNYTAEVSVSNKDPNEKLYEIMETTAKLYQNNLKSTEGKQAIEYLNKRGLDKEAIAEFGIGLAVSNRHMVLDFLKGKKYALEDITKVALITEEENPADVFTNRIMFPLANKDGRIIGFSGRIYYDSDLPKYINTRESAIFHKGNILFNYHRARPFIRNAKSVVVVEGYMDAIRLYVNGVKNVVALMGTALTDYNISLLEKLHTKIILCLDNDAAGQRAIYENGNLLKKAGIEVEVIKLSKAKDPDEYILTQGIEAFEKLLKEPLKFFDFSLNYLKQNKNMNTTVDVANYINEVLSDLAKETDDILIDLTLKKLAQEYNLEYDVLQSKLSKLTEKKKSPITWYVDKKNEKQLEKINKYDISCQKIIFYMMNDEKYVRIYRNNLVFIDNFLYREIAKAIIYYYETNKEINIADFLSFISSNERYYPEVLKIVNECDETLEEKTFEDYLKSIQKGNKQKTIKELKHELKEELDQNKKIEIAMKIAELKKGSV